MTSSYHLASKSCMLLPSLFAAAVVSCAYPNQFRNADTGVPRAMLTADPGDHWRDSGPAVFAINSQPTSFWRVGEKFHVPPGETVLTVIADREPYGFKPLRFRAVQGRHYHLRYGGDRRSVVLYDITNLEKTTTIAQTLREGGLPGSGPKVKTPEGEQAAP